jgi:outer membrane biosynthesis protein TonB
MKRCPQCEFIYEDDQSLCDMDGVLLVLDSRNLPNPHALAPIPAKSAKPQPKRSRAVPAFATLILALVLGMVYYVSIHRRAAQNTYTPSAAEAIAPEPVTPVVNPTPEPSEEVKAPAPQESKPAPAKQPETRAGKKLPVKTEPPTTQTKTEPKKDDSKVGSILKKTGRILKKPFKF